MAHGPVQAGGPGGRIGLAGGRGWGVGVEVAALVAQAMGVPGLDPVDVARLRRQARVHVGGRGGAGVVFDDGEDSRCVRVPEAAEDLVAGDGVVVRVVPLQGDLVVAHGPGEARGSGGRFGRLARDDRAVRRQYDQEQRNEGRHGAEECGAEACLTHGNWERLFFLSETSGIGRYQDLRRWNGGAA